MKKLLSSLLVFGAFIALTSSAFACNCGDNCKCANDCKCNQKCTQDCNCGCKEGKTCDCQKQNCNCAQTHKFRLFKKSKCECK